MTVIAFGFLALAGAGSTGARLLAEGRQRQAASEIANRQLEHIRNIPYDELALNATLTYASDPEDPDHHVNVDGTAYDHNVDAVFEDLVIESDGQVPHTVDVTVGPTELTVYQFVTWVDDPDVDGTEDYKRLTVVAYYRAPVNTGRPRTVRASALVTTGTVVIAGEAADPSEGTVPVPSPSAPGAPSGSCLGDTSGPTGTITILSGTGAEVGFTSSETVTLQVAPVDNCTPITFKFSNDNLTYGTSNTYNATAATATWTITGGEGAKSIWAKFLDGLGNSRTLGPQTITLDTTLPTTPGTLSRSAGCSATNRTVSMSWGSSTDTNFVGYRIYRSIDSEPFEVVAVTNLVTGSDTHKKGLDSVRFRVVGYDKAGNESGTTNEIALAKNQCS